ncbi:MAG: MazG family protein [Treponema sp.]|nr:MazG family protein [Treponema sp.]MBR6914103.1 MazG family protein [Treponema sp.]
MSDSNSNIEVNAETNAGKKLSGFEKLLEVVKTLRSENGCPWDKVQTPLTLRRYMVEECFETVDAITQGDSLHVKEELGDLFFNLVFDACIYEDNGDFSVDECLNAVADKLIRRHPHVFAESEGKAESDSDLGRQWDKIKENVEGRKEKCTLDSVPDGFPPLLKASKMLGKAAKTGFEWQSVHDVRQKVFEELSEVEDAVSKLNEKTFESESGNQNESDAMRLDSAEFSHLEEEFGDLLLSVVNYARFLGVDSTVAMERANRKFKKRFNFVENSMKENAIPMDENHLSEMVAFWNAAKKI